MKFLRVLFTALLFVIAFALVFQNQKVFTTKFDLGLNLYFYQIGPYSTYNIVIVGVAFVLGVLFAVIRGALYALSAGGELRRWRKRAKQLEAQFTQAVGEVKAERKPEEPWTSAPQAGEESRSPFEAPKPKTEPESGERS